MYIKIYSSELNRMMKTITQCIDQRDISNKANICITHDNNLLAIRGSNGTFSAVLTTPVLGGTGESFCVDGTMFARVCAMCNGEISIVTDEKTCTVKGVGRTKLPIVNAKIPAIERVNGNTVTVCGEYFTRCYVHVAYAISTDLGRVQLTGVQTESDGQSLKMVALDGFQMAVDETPCEGDSFKVIIPGAFMKLITTGLCSGEDVKITTDGHFVQAETDGMLMRAGLLAGEFPDYTRLIPTDFKTSAKVNVEAVRNALKAGNAVNNKQNLVKLEVTENDITIRNNSEQAEFEAVIACVGRGDALKIAFNDRYLLNTINSFDAEEVALNFNSSVSPMIVNEFDKRGLRLVLPVRVQ